jgi:predicted alpha/beta-fold hydrolase
VVSHKLAQCCRVIQPIRALSQIRLQSICRRGVLLKHASNLSLARCVFALLLGLPQETQKEVNIFLLALQITRRFKSQQLHMESHGGIYIHLFTNICKTNSSGLGAVQAQKTCLPKDCPCLVLCHGLSRSPSEQIITHLQQSVRHQFHTTMLNCKS